MSQLHDPFDNSLGDRHFKSQLDTVHLDEKLFYITDESESYYYQQPLEDSPKKKGKSKRFIIKCMFLAATARPKYNHHTKTWWGGKIGMYPIVEMVPATRNSKNRPAGTLETKCVNMNRYVYIRT